MRATSYFPLPTHELRLKTTNQHWPLRLYPGIVWAWVASRYLVKEKMRYRSSLVCARGKTPEPRADDSVLASPSYRDSGGRMSADLSDKRAADDELLNAFSSITDRMQGFLYRCRNDSAYTMLFMTNGIRTMCGYDPSEFIHNSQRTFVSITHADDAAIVDAAVSRAVATRSNWDIDYRLIRKGGDPIWIHEIGGGVFSDAGDLLYLEGFIVDVDDRKNLENENRVLLEGIGNVSGQIVKETSAILEILRSLKMLGINARIEAARSAASGAGFDVVAQEITNLAASSAEAAQRIKRLMDELQRLLVRKERR